MKILGSLKGFYWGSFVKVATCACQISMFLAIKAEIG